MSNKRQLRVLSGGGQLTRPRRLWGGRVRGSRRSALAADMTSWLAASRQDAPDLAAPAARARGGGNSRSISR
jgi:hypothetical protein